MKISERMRETLETAARNPLRRVHDEGLPGKPPWPAPANTLRALEQREMLERNERRSNKGWKLEEWTITDTGREALKPLEPRAERDRPSYLSRPSAGVGDYTCDPRFAIDDLEVIDPERLSSYWVEMAEIARVDTRKRREAARWLARQARAA